MIETTRLAYSYGGGPVIDGLSYRFPNGKKYGITGTPGCGKSTFLNLLAGVLPPDGGTVRINGFDLWKEPAEARRAFAYLPSGFRGDGDRTVYEYLDFIAGAYRVGGEKRFRRVHAAMELTGVGEIRNRPLKDLPAKDLCMVGVAQTLVGGNGILFFDAPDENLADAEKEDLRDFLLRLPEDKTLFFASSDREFLAGFCDTVLTLENGILTETPSEIPENAERPPVNDQDEDASGTAGGDAE